MMRMRVWMVVMVFFGVAASADERDHNGDQHKALCGLLKAAVDKWGEVEKREPADPLRKALGRTIFGRVDGGILGDLKGLPKDYNNVEGTADSRVTWCGNPYDTPDFFNALLRWSGHSAPHGLLCLCTVGEKGWPLNESDNKIEKLCGLGKESLAAEDIKGWGYTKHEGNKHVTATWTAIVTPCLQSSGMEDLKQALKTFLGKLVNKSNEWYTNRYQLGEGEPSMYDGCDGSEKKGVCVLYYNTTATNKLMPWWVDLQNALTEEEKFQEEKKKREEEEKRRQKEGEQITDEPHAEVLKSASTTPNQTEQNKHDSNLTDKIRKLNLTRSSSITRPTTWLLTTIIMI
ncbi:Variant surface glycoprotein [Trypanosoma congolense IL3000]|uniref:Variant surface glycoprotein n=1 Tax=Trypanosoma congolense (strain IL3000) TaxID=1068625 RepID=F9WDL2_TRYCI|nr:Variant surface glycoprotein [Trypanosoma congolense IL3000]